MEVHHHSHLASGETHTERKKWTHYFWEFLMLFLAVFCGFLAENQREHMIENRREKQYAKELYSELSDDSVVASNILRIRLDKEKDMDYLYSYFKDSSLTLLPREFYPAYTVGTYFVNTYAFEPKDGILSQLRNSGSLRYFKSMNLQKLFGDISVCINNIRFRNDQEYQYFASPVKAFILKHYDFNWLNEVREENENKNSVGIALINNYRQSNTTIEGHILNVSTFNREEASNMISFFKQMMVSTRTLQLNNYSITNHKLLDALRQHYNLK